jgi:hypothetical protein
MKYNLVGVDGNAFSVMGYVINAMRECHFSKADRDSYFNRAISGDYNHLLCVSIEMLDKCNEIADGEFYSRF